MSDNPIALQSKKWIVEALLQLLNEKEYRLITVSEISARALIDRRTFYRHFECKDDILRFVIDKISMEYLSALKLNAPTDTYSITNIFFSICLQHSDLFKQLNKNHLMYFLLDKFHTNLPLIHSQVRSKELANMFGQDMNYFLCFHAGGFWSLLSKWVADGMEKSPNELADLASKITDRLI